MKGILYALLICFIARSATAQDDCNVGKQLIDKLDNRIINGTWYAALIRPKSLSENNPCGVDTYVPRPDGKSDVTSVSESDVLPGVVEIVDGTKLNYTYDFGTFNVTGLYEVLDWSEKDGYLILGGCPKEVEDGPVMGVAFRYRPTKESSLEAAKAALEKIGLNPEDFYPNC